MDSRHCKTVKHQTPTWLEIPWIEFQIFHRAFLNPRCTNTCKPNGSVCVQPLRSRHWCMYKILPSRGSCDSATAEFNAAKCGDMALVWRSWPMALKISWQPNFESVLASTNKASIIYSGGICEKKGFRVTKKRKTAQHQGKLEYEMLKNYKGIKMQSTVAPGCTGATCIIVSASFKIYIYIYKLYMYKLLLSYKH